MNLISRTVDDSPSAIGGIDSGYVIDRSSSVESAACVNDESDGCVHESTGVGDAPAACSGHGENIETSESIESRVGMNRGQASAVTGTHGLNQSQSLRAADFSDNEAIGPQSQSCTKEIVEFDRASTLLGGCT